MGHKKAWASALGVIALVLFGFYLTPRLFPDLGWGLNELNQIAGIASLAVAAATLVVTLWPTRATDPQHTGGGDDDVVEVKRVRAKGSVKGRVGPTPAKGGRRITRVRHIRAGGDVIGQQTTDPHQEPPR